MRQWPIPSIIRGETHGISDWPAHLRRSDLSAAVHPGRHHDVGRTLHCHHRGLCGTHQKLREKLMDLLITLATIAIALYIVGLVVSIGIQFWVAKSMRESLHD